MGFGRKVGEGGASRWLLLLLAGVLLLAVVVTATTPGDAAEVGATTVGEDGLRGSQRICEIKCQHHHDPVNRKRCVDFCIRYQLSLDAVEENGATVTTGENILHGSRYVCELKCQHHHDPVNKKRCIDFCIRYQLALLFDVKEDDGELATTTDTITAGEDGVCASRRICKLKCQHNHDPTNRNQCTDFCIGYQVALDAIMENGATVTTGENTLRGSRHICELKCQHHHDPVNKKRCIDFCIRYQLALHDINGGATAAAAGGAIRQVV